MSFNSFFLSFPFPFSFPSQFFLAQRLKFCQTILSNKSFFLCQLNFRPIVLRRLVGDYLFIYFVDSFIDE